MSAVDVVAVMDMLGDHLADIAAGAESRGMVRVQAKREAELAEASEARAAVTELIEANRRTVHAFEALGSTTSFAGQIAAHRECEAAMVAQKAALGRIGGVA